MKRIIYFVALSAIMFACNSNNSGTTPDNIPITAGASVMQDLVSKSPVNSNASNLPTSAVSVFFARTNDAASANWATVTGAQTASVGNASGTFSGTVATSGAVTFGSSEYYNASPTLNSYLIGYYPASNTNYPSVANAGTLQWTIDGKTDIMYSGVQSGNRASSALAFVFNHQLTWLVFNIQAASGTGAEIADIWGNVTGISILNQSNTLTLTLPSTVAFSGSATINTFNASDAAPTALAIPAYNSAAFFSQAMVQPATYNAGISGNYQITVTTSNGGSRTIPISLTGNAATLAGNKHAITLTFGETAITATATITQWSAGTGGAGIP